MWRDRTRLFMDFLCMGTGLTLLFEGLPPELLRVFGGLLTLGVVAFRVGDVFPKRRNGEGDVRFAPHPGELVRKELETRGMKKVAEASRLLDVPRSSLSHVLNGKRPMNARLACALEAHNIGEAQKWLNLQIDHDLDRSRP